MPVTVAIIKKFANLTINRVVMLLKFQDLHGCVAIMMDILSMGTGIVKNTANYSYS